MKHRDRQIGRPSVVFKNTKSYIQSLTGVEEGAIAYATDTGELGYYSGSGWVWGSGGSGSGDMLKSVYDSDNDGIVDAAEAVPWDGVTGKPSTFPPSQHDHTFLSLIDTPSSYSGSSGKVVKVNPTEDGLEFGSTGDMMKSVYDADNDGIVDAAESVPWSGITGKPSTFPPDEHGHTFIGLTDTPSSYSGSSGKAVKVKSTEDGLEFDTVGDMLKSTYDTDNDGIVDAAETVPWDGVTGKPSTFPPSTHDHSFLSLTDTPSDYSGQAQKIVRVKSSEDGLEFAEGGGGAQTFIQLSDTPSSYPAGSAVAPLLVSQSGDSIVFGSQKVLYLGRAATQSIPNNSWTSPGFSLIYENGSNVSSTSYWTSSSPAKITIRDKGIFLLLVRCAFVTNNSGYRAIRITYSGNTRTSYLTALSSSYTVVFFMAMLNAGSVPVDVDMLVYQNSGGSLNIDGIYCSMIMLSTLYSDGSNFIA